MHEPSDESVDSNRRHFLSRYTLLAMTSAIGMHIPFGRFFPLGMTPAAFAAETPDLKAFGKHPDLVVLGDKPFVAETPAHLLDDEVTPIDRLFIRHNGIPPDTTAIDPQTWTLKIEGESVKNAAQFTLAELKSKFKNHTQHLALECGGNGRAGFNPPAKGNQWTTGGVGFPEWNGVLLRDVLKHAGVSNDAVYVAYYGADTHLSGDASKVVISRGVPIAKAMHSDCLIAWGVNGQDLPLHHGYPLRLIIAGYPGSASGKWLQHLAIRNKVHDGPGMTGHSYRVACQPIAPEEDFKEYCIIEEMPVKSLITFPRSGIEHAFGQALPIRGHAWTGQKKITAVDVSLDFGQTWLPTKLKAARNASGPQRFTTEITFPSKGYYEIWARAADDSGKMQPMVVPGWNAGGYANNAMHRVAVRVV